MTTKVNKLDARMQISYLQFTQNILWVYDISYYQDPKPNSA